MIILTRVLDQLTDGCDRPKRHFIGPRTGGGAEKLLQSVPRFLFIREGVKHEARTFDFDELSNIEQTPKLTETNGARREFQDKDLT